MEKLIACTVLILVLPHGTKTIFLISSRFMPLLRVMTDSLTVWQPLLL